MEKKLNKAEGYRKLLKIVVTLLVLIGLLGMMYSDEVKPIAEQRMQYVKSEVKGKLLELKRLRCRVILLKRFKSCIKIFRDRKQMYSH